jgi:glycosyltransferase involved in cell wall biosynthesis
LLSVGHVPAQPNGLPSERPAHWPKLTIVIPALNEEQSIGSTVQRCLDAREHICRSGHVREIEIVVVSDGSTDRTAEVAQEMASRQPAVTVVVFPKNRGYGAALKEGFQRGTGELVSFLDADGTCDPAYFADMCRVLQEESASMVLGSRLGCGNHMPRIRRLGNRVYAFVLGVLSGRVVTDTASGMRVLRRDALPELYPLPDGLHFTPAMSARALMNDMRIAEIPMAYAERVGESKLHVFRDGLRFFRAIADAMLLYRPSRAFNLVAVLSGLVGAAWALYPMEFYARERRLEEWMVYRIVLCTFLFSSTILLVGSGVVADSVLSLVHRRLFRSFGGGVAGWLFSPNRLCWAAVISGLGAVGFVWPGLVEYATTGQVTLHWSRMMVGTCFLQTALFAVIAAILQRVVCLWKGQIDYASRSPNRSEFI